MRALAFLVGLAVSVAFVSVASAQTTVVTPQPGGAQTLGGPTTIVTPTGNGGYRAQTLGGGTSVATPTGNGGYVVNHLGNGR